MTHSDDWNADMVLLDHDTADRLVRGAVPPDDAPPGYAEVAAFLGEMRDEPVVVDDGRLAEFTAAAQSSVASRARSNVRAARHRRRVPAAIVGGVAIAMLVGPVAARIARDIDRSSGPSEPPSGVVVTPPADGAEDEGRPPRRSSAPPTTHGSRAASTPAADRAAVAVPVASDAPPSPSAASTDGPAVATEASNAAPAAGATGPTCERGAEASAKDGRPCPGQKRAPDADADAHADADEGPSSRRGSER